MYVCYYINNMEKNNKRKIIRDEIAQITKLEESESIIDKFKTFTDYNKKDLSRFNNIIKKNEESSNDDE